MIALYIFSLCVFNMKFGSDILGRVIGMGKSKRPAYVLGVTG